MDPDDLSDDQLMRTIALGLAVFWTHTNETGTASNTIAAAEKFRRYIETGQR